MGTFFCEVLGKEACPAMSVSTNKVHQTRATHERICRGRQGVWMLIKNWVWCFYLKFVSEQMAFQYMVQLNVALKRCNTSKPRDIRQLLEESDPINSKK